MKLFFLIPGDINSLTGGYLYNKRMVEGLEELGHEVHIQSLDEPVTHVAAIEIKCRNLIRILPPGSLVIVDSLLLGILGRVIREYKDSLVFIGLIHLPVTYNTTPLYKGKLLKDFEVKAMNDTRRIIVTGIFMKHLLQDAGVEQDKISIVEPGVDSFPRKQHYADLPVELLCISNYSRLKAQLLLVSALSRLKNRNWTLRLYGNMNTGKDYVFDLKSLISRKKLHDRVLLYDTLERNDISKAFLYADLFVLPSLFESYGMVLTESLAHGIPVITTTAGNIPETVPATMGIFIKPGNTDELVTVLDTLFTDSEKYRSLCEASAGYYRQSMSWKTAAAKFEMVIREMPVLD